MAVVTGPDAGRLLELSSQPIITLGRSPRSTFALADPPVSRTHCQIEVGQAETVISDLGSTAGTRINGVLIRR